MILKGSQRGGAMQLARHLMNERDNDHISLHQMRGFVADNLDGAFKEIEAISRGTRCSQYLFSLSLNPPELENAPPAAFEAAIDDIEKKLGLADQPRAVIFHEKSGRRHAHCVWSRIDANAMRGINLPHFKMKLQDIARELFIEHQWDLPAGFKDKKSRDPLNYGSVESEQAKRVKRDPKRIKEIFRRCWEQSDLKEGFAAALTEQGYILAKGDRRGFVAVDRNGEVYSVSRWVGVKTKDVRARLGVTDGLPRVDEALLQFEAQVSDATTQKIELQDDKWRDDLLAFTAKRLELVKEQRVERDALAQVQSKRLECLSESGNQLPAGSLKSLWQRASGSDVKHHEDHEARRKALIHNHAQEKQQLTQDQLRQRRQLQRSYLNLQHHHELTVRNLWCELGLADADRNNDKIPCADLCVSDPEQPLVLADAIDKSVAQRVRKYPPTILEIVSRNKEEFTRNDIVRGLSNYIDDPTQLYLAIDQTFKSDDLVETGTSAKKRYTTKELVKSIVQLQSHGSEMVNSYHGRVKNRFITAAIKTQNRKLQRAVGADLSDEQETAIKHVLGSEQLSIVTGYAGAGKSTMLEAASDAWRHSGINVIGAALSGKAADGLEKSSGIQSRTLASLEKSWEGGYSLLTKRDVLVIDEAGMVDLRQMARIIAEVKKRAAKLVLVGDAEQLQPIQAGTPFKELEQLVGSAKLTEIRRQKQDWQREASKFFAEQRTDEALQLYQDQGCTTTSKTNEQMIASLVKDYMLDVEKRGMPASRLALAHRRKDVHLINQSIRSACQNAGLLNEGIKVKTDQGPREFCIVDRIVLTRNDRDLNVRNGMLGTVAGIASGTLSLAIDGDNTVRTINPKTYTAIDHGYATTIHKSQGTTVDKCFVLASKTMDRHLIYVAMSRHRVEAKLYDAQETKIRSLQTYLRSENSYPNSEGTIRTK